MKGALDVHGALLAVDVPHEVVRLPRSAVTADDLPEALDVDPASCGAVRCYVADGCFVAVLVRAGCVPDPVALLDVLRARSVRLAAVGEVNAATDFAAALVSPVALPAEVVLLVDGVLAGDDVRWVPAGEGRVALAIRGDDLVRATGARVARLRARRADPAERPGWDGVVPQAGRAPAAVVDLRDARADRAPRRPAG